MSAYRPYPKYKPTGVEWLGDVPAGWVISKPKFSAPFQVGWTPPTGVDANFEGDNLWANISDLKKKIITSTVKRISDDAALKASMSITPRGSLLYSFKLSVGAVAFAGVDLYTNEAIASFLANQHSDLQFLYYAFQVSIIENASENIYGAKILNQELIRSANFPLPPLAEQHQIAAFLDRECGKLDALQAKQERLIGLLKEKRQALISHAVTRGLDPTAKLKPSGIEWLGEVPGHWRVGKCGFYLSILSGFAFPSTGFTQDESQTKLLRGINVGVSRIKWDDTVYWQRSENDGLGCYELKAGDLVVGMDRPWISEGVRVAKISEDDLPSLLLQRVTSIKTSSRLSTDYLFRILSSEMFVAYFTPDTTGVSVPHISPDQICDFVIPIPPLAEQRAIVAHLDEKCGKIDQLKAKAERGIELLKERRSALISAAVTGKIDVRQS